MHRPTRLSTRRGVASSQRASALGWILWFVLPVFISCAALLTILSFVLTLEAETKNQMNSIENHPPEHFLITPSRQQQQQQQMREEIDNKPRTLGNKKERMETIISDERKIKNRINNSTPIIIDEKTTYQDTTTTKSKQIDQWDHTIQIQNLNSTNHTKDYYDDEHDDRPITVVVVAYAISLIKCGDFQSSTTGLQDAALVLKHSIHQTSIRNPQSGSRYDYKAYAIVHRQATNCAHELEDAGYELVIRDPPVEKSDIRGEYLRKKIHKEWCCGSDEFVKLYAYHLTDHPIVVHVDIDFIFHKPMDDLFDAMLDPGGEKGILAKSRIPRERPNDPWPQTIDAYMTRDWGQVMPGRKALFQAGFLVVRPDHKVFDQIVEVIKEGNYVEGFSRSNGWGGLGYGGLVGAMAAQGLIAYVYDTLFNNTWVELNQCRYNHMGMDVLYRSQPSFRQKHPKVGKCRNDLDYCEDCQTTDVEKIYNIHYTQCRKPWNCIGEGDSTVFEKSSIPEESVKLDHCMELLTIWHDMRTSLETQLYELTGDETIKEGQTGSYKRHVFHGHCNANGQSAYLPISAKPESRKRIKELYTKL